MAAINLNIGGDTRQLDRDIQKTVNRVYSINLKTKGDQPLGRITGKVNEFEKSLAASNARVIAFGASAGIIFGLQRAFSSLVESTIEVQKSLQDINVILNVSTTQLNKFGGELFNIAKNTGQSFKNVAEAATEFSRQGLGLEETLKRTNEALILSRLSGLDATKSVEALTAAVNSYASQAVTASEVVNKFANVDAAFAVSSADLAEALARVGSSAAQSGVSLNELIAIVTSAQQTTARGGAVIGNSFKTIFTRLQRGKVVDLLGTLGISDTGANGEVKSTIQLLQELGKVYDTLGARQQAAVAEQVGGVFQINILKAALADLGKEYSIYNNALNVAAASTDQAVRRNEELNKTFAAQLNALKQNITQFSGSIGESLLAPLFDRTVGNLNELLGGINEGDANSFGGVLGKGILDGLGQVLAGPGLALLGGVLIKLFRDFSIFASGSLKDLLGLNSAAKQQGELQKSIAQIISKNPDLYALMQKGATGLNQASQTLLQNLKAQTLELSTQQKLTAVIAKQLYGSGVRFSGGIPVAPTSGKSGKPGKAAGYIPNFSAEVSDARGFGASKNVREAKNKGTIGGKPFQPNTEEIQISNFAGTGETAVIPEYGGGIKEAAKMIARGESGSVLDKSDRNRARGFVPNFAQKSKRGYSVFDGDSLKVDQDYPDERLRGKEMRLESVDAIEKWQKYGEPQTKKLAEGIINNEFPNLDSALKSSGKTGKAAYDRPYFKSTKLQKALIKEGLGVPDLRYGSSFNSLTMGVMNKPMPIGLWSDKNKDGFYNHPKAQQFIKQNNLEKKLALERPDLTKNDKNFRLGSVTRFGTGRYGGELLPDTIKSKGKPGSKNYRPERAYNYQTMAASGFIPNFAPIKFPSAGYSADSEQARKDLLRQDYKKNILESYRRSNIKNFRGKNFKQEREMAVREAQSNRQVYKQVKGISGSAISTIGHYKNRPGDSPGKMVVTEELEGLNVREVRDHEYTGTESNALTVENGKIVLEDYNPKSSKRFPFKAKYRKKINELAGALKMPVIERSALTKQLATSRIAAIRNDRSGIYQNSRYAENDVFASGFIPNFAQIKKAIDLGNLDTIPNKLGNKVVSLIHPGLSDGYSLNPATASYLKQEYRGNIPVAGINQTKLKSQIPDLDKNLGDLLVKEANQFGQSLGGSNFLKSAKDLPNFGAAKGAVGVAFEGGVQTLLQQKVGRKQNAGIDFRNITPRLRSIFNEAPGMYDAKSSPALTNEVFKKLLNETRPGAIVQKSSGQAGKEYSKKRQDAVDQLRKEGVTGSVAIRQALKERFNIIGKAAGYIPNFAAISEVMALETAMSGEKAIFDTKPFPHVRNRSQPTFGSAMVDHGGKKQALKDSLMGQKRAGLASGFIPNFAVGESSEPADLGSSIAALTTQLGGLAFMLSFSKDGIKNSLQEMVDSQVTASGMTVADAKLQQEAVLEEIVAAQAKQAAIKEEMATAKQGSKEAKALSKEHANATKEVRKLSQAQASLSSQIRGTKNKGDVTTATRTQKMGAAIGGNAMAIGLIAPILAETAANAIGTEDKGSRMGSAAVSGLGNTASIATMGFQVGGWGT